MKKRFGKVSGISSGKRKCKSNHRKISAGCEKFYEFSGREHEINKELLISYKQWLIEHYSVNSVNSMIAALNQYLMFLEKGRLRLKRVQVQRMDIQYMERELNKEEFQKMVKTARKIEKEQTAMIMETICATGIRVSELKFSGWKISGMGS